METLRVGSYTSNDIIIQQPGISGSHALLTLVNDNEFWLEDLQSTYGTWVDGEKIKKRKVNHVNTIRLGGKDGFPFDIAKQLLEYRSRIKGNDYTIEFVELKEVYYGNRKMKDQMRRQQNISQSVRGALPTALGAIPSIFGGSTRYWWLSLGGLLLGGMWAYFKGNEFTDKMDNLEAEFREQYRCPKCNRPFGNERWETLAKNKICSNCKAIWVK